MGADKATGLNVAIGKLCNSCGKTVFSPLSLRLPVCKMGTWVS